MVFDVSYAWAMLSALTPVWIVALQHSNASHFPATLTWAALAFALIASIPGQSFASKSISSSIGRWHDSLAAACVCVTNLMLWNACFAYCGITALYAARFLLFVPALLHRPERFKNSAAAIGVCLGTAYMLFHATSHFGTILAVASSTLSATKPSILRRLYSGEPPHMVVIMGLFGVVALLPALIMDWSVKSAGRVSISDMAVHGLWLSALAVIAAAAPRPLPPRMIAATSIISSAVAVVMGSALSGLTSPSMLIGLAVATMGALVALEEPAVAGAYAERAAWAHHCLEM